MAPVYNSAIHDFATGIAYIVIDTMALFCYRSNNTLARTYVQNGNPRKTESPTT